MGSPVVSSGAADWAKRCGRQGRGRKRSRGLPEGCRRGSRWAGASFRSRRGWPGRWRSPRCAAGSPMTPSSPDSIGRGSSPRPSLRPQGRPRPGPVPAGPGKKRPWKRTSTSSVLTSSRASRHARASSFRCRRDRGVMSSRRCRRAVASRAAPALRSRRRQATVGWRVLKVSLVAWPARQPPLSRTACVARSASARRESLKFVVTPTVGFTWIRPSGGRRLVHRDVR